MRQITSLQFSVFVLMVVPLVYLSYLVTNYSISFADWEYGKGVAASFLFFTVFGMGTIGFYRLFLKIFPLKTGSIDVKSKEEFAYHIHLLFNLFFFYPLMSYALMPLPFRLLFYKLFGVRFGKNFFTGGLLIDYKFIEIGDNTILGMNSAVFCHVIEGEKLAHFPVKIGNNVTVGAHSLIMPGVTIEDGAIVAVNSTVIKGTHIGKNEIWGGNPAKFIKLK